MRTTLCVLILTPFLCLADAAELDYYEPVLDTPIVATNVAYVTDVLEEKGWSLVEATEVKVSAIYVGEGRDERLTFTFTPTTSTSVETHQDILTVEYTYVPWLEIEGGVERVKAEFNRLVSAFDYLIGPGMTETSAEEWSHTWPGRDASRIELILAPMYATKLTVSVNLVPLQEWEPPPEGETGV